MKNIKSILLTAIVGVMTVGCYNDFGTPQPTPPCTDSLMQLQGLRQVSIKEMRAAFTTAWGGLSNTGTNAAWDDAQYAGEGTKTVKFGAPDTVSFYTYIETPNQQDPTTLQVKTIYESDESNHLAFAPDFANAYIKGKVISSDDEGNIYKSLYIFDGTAAIELKLHNDLFMEYHLDLNTLQSQWVYVKLKDLYLGNYRMMLSLGASPSDSYNTAGAHKYYANSNIESPARSREIVLAGEPTTLTVGSDPTSDIFVVNSSNYRTTLFGPGCEQYFDRLVRWEGVTIRYPGVPYVADVSQLDTNGDGVIDTKDTAVTDVTGGYTFNATAVPPQWVATGQPDGKITIDDLLASNPNNIPVVNEPALKNGTYAQQYPTWIVTDWGNPVFSPWFRWAYHNINQNVSLYSSVVMSYNDDAVYTSDAGIYSIRTSGYSRFSNDPIPADGTVGTVTGIYGIYSQRSTYTGGASDYAQYQITVSRVEDLDFPKESLLTDEWINFNTPAASYYPNVKEQLPGDDTQE